jgi:hypothetical protein
LSFYAVIANWVRFQSMAGGDHAPADFVFDEQGKEIGRALKAWKHLERAAPPALRPMLRNPPISRNDKTVLPLQAADLLAWRLRRMFEDAEANDDRATQLLSFPETMKLSLLNWNRSDLEEQYTRIAGLPKSQGGVFPYQLNRSDRRRAEKSAAARERKGEP